MTANGAVANPDSGDSGSHPGGFRYPLDVRFYEVDSLGVVFNMWYLGWCDEAMSAFMESIGYGYATLRAQGMDAVLRKAELEWRDSLQAFQQGEISVQVDQVGTTSFRLSYDINRVHDTNGVHDSNSVGRGGTAPDGASQAGKSRTMCARAAITYVCVQIEDRAKAPIPPGLREALMREHT